MKRVNIDNKTQCHDILELDGEPPFLHPYPAPVWPTHTQTLAMCTHARNTRTIKCLARQYDELDHDVNICRISDIASELTEKHSDAGVVAKITCKNVVAHYAAPEHQTVVLQSDIIVTRCVAETGQDCGDHWHHYWDLLLPNFSLMLRVTELPCYMISDTWRRDECHNISVTCTSHTDNINQ